MRWIHSLTLATALAANTAHADAFDDLRARWHVQLVGAAALDRSDPDVTAQLQSRARTVQGWLARMQSAPDAAHLWDDAAAFNDPKGLLASAAVTANAFRLRQMALAYATPGSPLHRDATLGAATLAGLDWLVTHHYRAGKPAIGNWWDWQIGTPLYLLDVLSLMDPPAEVRARALAAVNWHVPNPRYRTRNDGSLRTEAETGANLLDKALVGILSGMLARDQQRVTLSRDAISPALQLVEQGDGFYRDGSFVQHAYVPYTGSYGAVALADFARLVSLLTHSAWPITDPGLSNVFLWARDAYAPWIIDGAMPDALRGRKIATPTQTEHSVGRSMTAYLATLAEAAPPADAAALRAAVKGWMTRDRSFGARYLAAPSGVGTSGLSLYELGLLRKIAADPAIPAAPEAPGARVYAAMDRAILRGPGFAATLSMASPRISSFESGNGENLQAWWTGMGMLSLYTADQTQFGGDFWATVDIRRLPGTTTDRSGSGRPVEWKLYPNTESWVGGVAQGSYAALGMAFSMREVTGSPLHGKKSWFMLGDRILALGAGIGDGQGATETVVENRKLASPQAQLVVDGAQLANGRKAGARWAHLRDAQAGSSIGYVFPHGAEIVAEHAERSGNWRALNDQQSAQEVRATFQTLSIPHSAGAAGSYAYLLLPSASEAATAQAARDPGLRIEANDALAAAVSDTRANVYAANLWQAGSAPRGGSAYVSASGPAAVVLAEEGGRLRLSAADPTQSQAAIELTVARPVGAVLSAVPGVTVLQTMPQLRLRIDTARAAGSGYTATFALPLVSGSK
ncbi:hyaluronate lyase [Duganella sp. CF402]|uniref:polysaccharide lyase 8 family protein n=1 Tax=unclassified Duganella TaxID=2636909 RepID=UPI0008B1338A|nr:MULTISPECIES: polysaccharide lyase 8 family protein [unclassified Duganella]RZT11323.1 hyaluronate lyase [Duganella sp. BK701]SEK70368.1 hyaluronate lyase [Duganella sp. CF402]